MLRLPVAGTAAVPLVAVTSLLLLLATGWHGWKASSIFAGAVPPPPPTRGKTQRPPGCYELQNPDRPQWHLPLSDPTFHELCASKPVASSRGHCYFLKRRKIVRCLPSFLVVGFTKSGTSAFFQYVAQHHQIRTARIKEPAFLGSDVEAAAQNGTALEDAMDGSLVVPGDATRVTAAPAVKTLRWYLNLFPPCAQCERGEATPSYAWRDFSAVAAVQARLLLGGDIKLIMLVREPIERAASHYVYFREKRRAFRNGNLSFVLRGALDEFERCAAQLGGWRHDCTYRPGRRAVEVAAAAVRQTRPELWRLKNKASYELLQAGLYVEHLRTWRAQFPSESMLVLDSALLLTAPLRAMRRFEKHLGVPPVANYDTSLEHALASPRQGGGPAPGAAAGAALASFVDAELRGRLERFFTPFNRRLKKATGVGWTYSSTPPHLRLEFMFPSRAASAFALPDSSASDASPPPAHTKTKAKRKRRWKWVRVKRKRRTAGGTAAKHSKEKP